MRLAQVAKDEFYERVLMKELISYIGLSDAFFVFLFTLIWYVNVSLGK
jgi:hypothetical protein